MTPVKRPAQKRRTRKAILDAAMALLAAGQTPTVNEVAAAAEVSRRTIFLYFPTFDQLLIDATLGALSQAPVDRAIAAPAAAVPARLEALMRALQHVTPEIERLGRSLIRLTVEAPAGGDPSPRRGYRRIEWIETALSPWRQRFSVAEWRRLVCGLAMVAGWEALIVQRDVCGLSVAEGEALSVWAAGALLGAALRDRRLTRPAASTRRSVRSPRTAHP
jgi:AcrR family transcriptional regulator